MFIYLIFIFIKFYDFCYYVPCVLNMIEKNVATTTMKDRRYAPKRWIYPPSVVRSSMTPARSAPGIFRFFRIHVLNHVCMKLRCPFLCVLNRKVVSRAFFRSFRLHCVRSFAAVHTKRKPWKRNHNVVSLFCIFSSISKSFPLHFVFPFPLITDTFSLSNLSPVPFLLF